MNEPTNNSTNLPLSTSKMQTAYANFVRGLMTSEEIILDFGINPNLNGKLVDEPLELSHRIILSYPSAARLYQILHAILSKHQESIAQQLQQPVIHTQK